MGVARQKIAGGDTQWLAILTICATLGVFGYWASTNIARIIDPKAIGIAMAAIMGGVLAMFFFKLSDWIRAPRLKEWALGLAMFGGMIFGKLIAG